MNVIDRALQRWRLRVALRWIRPDARVLDIGCADGALGRRLRGGTYLGIDPDPGRYGSRRFGDIHEGYFPGALPDGAGPFDAVVMLAILEHVPPGAMAEFATAVAGALAPGGRLVVTVPAPLVDHILDVAMRLHVLDGMESEAHHGFDPTTTPTIFGGAGLRLVQHRRFQLGLNHLYVFERPP